MARLGVALSGVEAVLGGLDRLSGAMRGGLRNEARAAARRIQEGAQARAQFGASGRTQEAIRLKEFDEGDGNITMSVFVGTVRDDRGTRPALLPVWLEYGTRKMPARPFLIPAFEQERPRFEQATAKVLQDAAAKG